MSASVSTTWLEAQEAIQQRNLRWGMVLSAVLHTGFGAFLAFAPDPEPVRLPEVISVRMVSLPAAPASARQAAPEPGPTPAKPLPAPAPAPVPPKKVILPKRPAPVSKKPKRKPKPKPLEYDDALAALREELGEQVPAPGPVVEDAPEVDVEVSEAAQGNAGGAEVDPEFAAWRLATRRRLKQVWVVPPDFLDRGLVAGLIVTLSDAGDVLGQPVVTRTSGDPYFDDNTVRALVRASPLPAPPDAGDWPFQFTADEGP